MSAFAIADEVLDALRSGAGVVALETSVVAQGLPAPHNLAAARACEAAIRAAGAVPATVAVLGGVLRVGITADELSRLASLGKAASKAGARELPLLCARGADAGTTVSGTLAACRLAGIRVFATGGIGGVHRRGPSEPLDVSADLAAIAETQAAVVCAGAKSILDLPATLEALETLGVPVWGLGASELPAFFHNESGLAVERADVAEVARALHLRWGALAQTGGAVVANPVPAESALPKALVEDAIAAALSQARADGVRGAAVTPYLLAAVAARSGGRTLATNLAVLESNARAAANLAVLLASAPDRATPPRP